MTDLEENPVPEPEPVLGTDYEFEGRLLKLHDFSNKHLWLIDEEGNITKVRREWVSISSKEGE